MMQRRNGAPTPCDAGALSQMSERRQSDRGVADGANVAVGGLIALEHVGVAQGQHSRAQSVLTSSKHVLAQSPPIHWRVQSMSERQQLIQEVEAAERSEHSMASSAGHPAIGHVHVGVHIPGQAVSSLPSHASGPSWTLLPQTAQVQSARHPPGHSVVSVPSHASVPCRTLLPQTAPARSHAQARRTAGVAPLQVVGKVSRKIPK